MSSKPVRVLTFGSLSQSSHVYLMSALVSGSPSDHLIPGLSFQVTSILSPLRTTPPFATSGTSVASVGTYLPSVVVSARPSTVPLMTRPRTVWLPYGAPSVVGSCQIATIAVPPRVIGCAVALAAADADVAGVVVGAVHAVATSVMANANVIRRDICASRPVS